MQHHKRSLKASLQPLNDPFSETGEGKNLRLILSALAALISICFLLVSCGRKPVSFTPDERKVADSIVRSTHGIDSLASLQKRLESEGDRLGSIIALREWARHCATRAASRKP